MSNIQNMSKKSNINKDNELVVTKYITDKVIIELIYDPELNSNPLFAIYDIDTKKVLYMKQNTS